MQAISSVNAVSYLLRFVGLFMFKITLQNPPSPGQPFRVNEVPGKISTSVTKTNWYG
ncbi:hypothetical protein SBA5_30017 [Candidatus Sulfotelmatomonas gaucii]|uniref:Uncharacterized protein n=1 Tax=Candidatus Sulfuritelmatomonas gaucii TaxID=2043161 RepID=A0A2N9LBZ4_9BACT|nr:hypothetical protein SBA5_30017 [Candidatus Sulfotelmatomonas gaucii]